MKITLRISAFLACVLLFLNFSYSQSTWTAVASLGNGATPRYNACGMAIGTKGYIGNGFLNSHFYNDFFEYDPSSNAWTQKTSFPGTERSGSVAFSIGTKGYEGLGYDGTNYKNDVWEYDQGSNSWTQKANFAGVARSGAVGFSIGTKGYVGTGYDGTVRKNDFYEFDATNNSWTAKANFGGVGRSAAVGFSIGTKGYIGTGYDGTNRKNDFWEYSQLNNTWTQKANFTGTARSNAVGFAIGSKGYIGTGLDPSYKGDFYEYNPTNNSWTQKAAFGGGVRYSAAGFSIGTKGYIGTGYDGTYKYDFWEYDQAGNIWTQKATFGGYARSGAVSFSINDIGYMGTGYDGNAYKNDFWKYDPNANTWTQKANFSGTGRTYAAGFAIGSKGYVGTGYSGSGYLNDLYEYDPNANSWTAKANFTGTARSASAYFVIGTKAYVGMGTTGTNCKNDWYEYDQLTNSWSTKASVPSASKQLCTGFAVSSKGYVAAGIDNDALCYGDLWQYDPNTNSWLQKADIPANSRRGAAGTSMNGKGYIVAGINDNDVALSDVWEYNPTTGGWVQKANFTGGTRHSGILFLANGYGYFGFGDDGNIIRNDLWQWNPVNTLSLGSNSVCTGANLTINFTTSDYYAPGNIFSAQLSDSDGAFGSPVTIGTVAGTTSGTINATIPTNATAGSNYLVRVVGSSPALTVGTSSTVTIKTTPVITSCPSNVTAQASLGLCSNTVSYSVATASGTPTPTISYSKNSGSSFNVGTNNVIVTATNLCGSANCNFSVIVEDGQGPSISTPADITINANNANCTATGVNLGTPMVSDNCGIASLTNNAPVSFPYGQTYVTWTVVDPTGNSNAGDQIVTVIDNQLPSITCPSNVNVNAAPGQCAVTSVNLGTPITSDNCGILSVTNNAPSSYPVGNTIVIWTATDIHNNSASCNQTVTVIDNQLPVISGCPSNIQSNNHVVTWTTPTASDNCGIASFTSNHNPGETFPTGTTNVTYTATDVNGNISTCNFTVTVNGGVIYTVTPGGPTTFCKPGSVTLTVSPAGTSYKWYKNNVVISGATQISYVVTITGNYYCKVTSGSGTANSNTVSVTAANAPTATITPSGTVNICAGQTITLSANTGAGLSYQWIKGTANINGATNSTYIASTKGSYKVKVTNSSNCSKTSAVTKVTMTCKEEMNLVTEHLNIYPNPTTGNVIIDYQVPENNGTILMISDLLGKIVHKQDISSYKGTLAIDLSGEPEGVYLLKLSSGEMNEVRRLEVIR